MENRTEEERQLITMEIFRVFKIDITAAYLTAPINDDVKHKWVMCDRDVFMMLPTMDENYSKSYLRRDCKNFVMLNKFKFAFL